MCWKFFFFDVFFKVFVGFFVKFGEFYVFFKQVVVYYDFSVVVVGDDGYVVVFCWVLYC